MPLVLAFLTVSFPGQVSSSPSPTKVANKQGANVPTTAPPLTPVASQLKLSFFRPNNWTCPNLPNANPVRMPGSPTPPPTNRTTFYCKVTIEPMASTTRYTASTYKFVWQKQGEYLEIKVPKEEPSKITVEFYDDCNSCIAGQIGRPYWKFSGEILAGQPFVTANLEFFSNPVC
jgi:hypothetical protein